MWDFIFNVIIWVLALYGLIEIIKTIIYTYTYTNLKPNGTYIIIAVKNQEDKIEGLLRSVLFKITYGTEEYIKNIIVVDLNSKDDTKKIIERMSEDNENIKVTSWKECRELFDNIDDIKNIIKTQNLEKFVYKRVKM